MNIAPQYIEIDVIDWVGAVPWKAALELIEQLKFAIREEGFEVIEVDNRFLIPIHSNAIEQAIQLHDLKEVVQGHGVERWVHSDANSLKHEVDLV